MEVTCSSETSDDFQQITSHSIPEERTLHNHRCENLKSYRPYGFTLKTLAAIGEALTNGYFTGSTE
jgi:hypothetical protein